MEALFRNSRRKLTHGLLFWREVGQGIPVVFLHGTWSDGSQWVSVMEMLGSDFHCLTPDLLGFGESEIPEIHYSIDLQVETIAEWIEKLRLEKVYLVGHSLGSWIAASYALKYPERVSGLVLLAPEGVKTPGIEQYWRQMQRILNRSELSFALLRLLRPIAKVFGWEIKVEEEWRSRLIMEQYPVGCELLFNRQLPELQAELVDNRFNLHQCRTLILHGGKDRQEVFTASQAYTRLISGAKMQIITHGENDLPQSCSGEVAEEIRDFLGLPVIG
ncbi:alpha/beta fold hydrolase [Calothrix sp. PCC 6303]|uniref:alpha/beta fold hydrolase n=1 Tax=Calothrix sp. PCC 6303 TaxID=1170562 RepID=UPI0002A032AD|nr:alpha/beta hydrolase [Calothrix sp. PCC 6303]AFZ00691.1 alpha/beta hydrolase fold protein [Calothrix sp. PCC 6303]